MSLNAEVDGFEPLRSEVEASRARIAVEAVRAYDVRGVVGRDLDEEGARALGLSYAAVARAEGLRDIAVGRDGRTSSPALEQALVAGLVEGGMGVERIGLCPTPMLAFAVRTRGLDGGIMVTASHNPPAENGFKLLMGDARVHGAALRELVETPGRAMHGGSVRAARVTERYLDGLVAAARGMAPLKVAWDCGNGATGRIVERLVQRLPGEHRLLYSEVDGRFPNHHPDPAVETNLQALSAAVTEGGCDLGVAFDGDGDRLGVVDQAGRVVWADQVLVLLACDMLQRHPGSTVVADVKCSRALFDGVAACGGRAVLAPSGYVHVRETMRRVGALMGGELSGHLFFADGWHGVDDAIYAAIRTFHAVTKIPGGLAAFRDGLPKMAVTPELRIPCPEHRKAEVVREVAGRLGVVLDPVMGLRVTSDDGWWLLRASGTEPKLTCRAEASDLSALERVKDDLRGQLRSSGVEIPAF